MKAGSEMEIVYVGDLAENGTCLARLHAFRRLGFKVRPVDAGAFMRIGSPLAYRLRVRTMIGRAIQDLNKAVVAASLEGTAPRVWFDKAIWMKPWALETLRQAGRKLYNFTLDNPFHTMNEPGWYQFRRNIPLFDVGIVPRHSSIVDYQAAGAGMMALFPMPFDPFMNYPARPWPPARTVDVSYIGSPYEKRPAFLAALLDSGLALRLAGEQWRRYPVSRHPAVRLSPALYCDAYRQAIWDARINLAFLTETHRDVIAHKAREITASGSFLLAVRCEGHQADYVEGQEAEFFSSPEEAADKIRFYLKHDAARERIALAGCHRTWCSGSSQEEYIASVFRTSDPELGAELTRRAAALMASRRRELGLE